LDPEVMRGICAIPHGHLDANINNLTSFEDMDTLGGMAFYSAVPDHSRPRTSSTGDVRRRTPCCFPPLPRAEISQSRKPGDHRRPDHVATCGDSAGYRILRRRRSGQRRRPCYEPARLPRA
jgi:hypothetical protein